MAYALIWSDAARADVDEIEDYIAQIRIMRVVHGRRLLRNVPGSFEELPQEATTLYRRRPPRFAQYQANTSMPEPPS